MARSYETFSPSLTICPAYAEAYNKTNLNKFGIGKANDYRKGDWHGNSTLDGRTIFKSVAHNFSDLVETLTVNFQNGGKSVYSGSFENMNVTEKGHLTFGRCFQIHPMNESISVNKIDIKFLKSIYIYFSMPKQFYNDNSKSKLEANVGEKLFLDITYEILKNNYVQTCKSYDYESYDSCKSLQLQKTLLSKFNCTLPFATTSKYKVCKSTVSREASTYFKSIYNNFVQCKSPCTNLLTTFGFPSYDKNDGSKGFVRLYFKSIVKITEDFVSYDLLR